MKNVENQNRRRCTKMDRNKDQINFFFNRDFLSRRSVLTEIFILCLEIEFLCQNRQFDSKFTFCVKINYLSRN